MSLKVFSKIDEIVSYYENTRDGYEPIAKEIRHALESLVVERSMFTLSIIYRIKEASSVREKMIRNSSYRMHDTAEETIADFQDIIGLRIDCKFIEDEAYVFDVIKTVFDSTSDYIYYYNNEFPNIMLKLCEHQPQKQKNGFDIYKVAGIYCRDGKKINFELQIKSMVNTFWGDIEHKIIYKNNAYIVMDDLVLSNMTSIKENLNLIDSQLHQLYRRYKREDNSNSRMRYKNIDATISKMIHDTFASKMSTSLGFVVDFKDICDSIIQYLLVSSNTGSMDEYGQVMLDIFYICNKISKENIEFNESLELGNEISFPDDTFSSIVLDTIKSLINTDFQWHIFFLILFNVQRGENGSILENYIRYYRSLFVTNNSFSLLSGSYSPEEINEIKKELVEEIANIFARKTDIQYLCKKGIAKLSNALSNTIEEISVSNREEGSWDSMKGKYLSGLNESL